MVCLGHGIGFAQSQPTSLLGLSLEELSEVTVDTIITASKFSQKLTDAPAAVTVVTKEQIQRFGYRSLAEVVRGVRGYDITYDRNYTYTGVRGFNGLGDFGSRTLLLVDGHRMPEPIYDTTGYGGDAQVDVDLIERVEFVRGPSSAVYGSNAFFGVINVITRRGRDVNGLEMSARAGSFASFGERLTLGGQLDSGLEYFFSASAADSEGQRQLYYPAFDSPLTHHGVALNQDAERYWSTLGRLSCGDFTVQGGYLFREKDVPTGAYGSVFNLPNTTIDARGYADLKYSHESVSGWSLLGRAHYDVYDFNEQVSFLKEAGPTPNDDSARARWWGAELGASRKVSDSLRLAAGLEMHQGRDWAMRNYDPHPFVSYLDVTQDDLITSTYVDTEWKFAPQLTLAAGLSWVNYESTGQDVDPRAALVWAPDKDTTLKFLYGSGFHAPNVYQLAYTSPTFGFAANPDLKPETIRAYEVVAEHYLGQHWHGSVSLFRNELSGLIEQSEAGAVTSNYNLRDVCVRGGEVEMEGKWDNGMLLRASYSRQLAEDASTGAWVVNSPKDMFKTQCSVPVWHDKLFASLEMLYASNRLTLGHHLTPDSWLLNLTLFGKEIAPGLDVALSVYNLLGQQWQVPGGLEHQQDVIPQDGRTVQIKFTYHF